MRFENTVAIVTGAAQGIGRATALALAAEGADVMVNDVTEAGAARVADEITATGGRAASSSGSVADVAYVQRLVSQTEAQLGPVMVLVNNAGITSPAMTLKMTPEEWQRVIDVNLTGVFNCTQAVGETMRRRFETSPEIRCAGRIVSISSVAALRGTNGQANYSAAKAGVIGLTMSIAREWSRYRITANAVAFGVVETPMTERVRTDERFRDRTIADILLHRYASPEEAARAILFLASADADYITGHTLNMSGGFHISI